MLRSRTLFCSPLFSSKLSLIKKQPFIISNRKYTNNPSSEIVKLSYTQYDPPKFHEPHEGPYLIILHGLFGSKQNWKSLAKTFAQRSNARVFTLVFETFHFYKLYFFEK